MHHLNGSGSQLERFIHFRNYGYVDEEKRRWNDQSCEINILVLDDSSLQMFDAAKHTLHVFTQVEVEGEDSCFMISSSRPIQGHPSPNGS